MEAETSRSDFTVFSDNDVLSVGSRPFGFGAVFCILADPLRVNSYNHRRLS